MIDLLLFPALLLILSGVLFFTAGTIGLQRLPDLHSRLHALTKADNLGLGLIALGLALLQPSWLASLKVILIWLLVLLTSSVSSHLIARHAMSGKEL